MKCEICGKKYNSNLKGGLTLHIKKVHNVNEKDYYDKYILKNNENLCPICHKELTFKNINIGYSKECLNCITRFNTITCQICGKIVGTKGLNKHFKTHNISTKEYYDKYIKKDNEGICLNCGKPTKFTKFTIGYSKYCCQYCSGSSNIVKEKRKQTNINKYGVAYTLQEPSIRQQISKTNLEKYGGNGWASKEIAEKTKITNLERYGIEQPNLFGSKEYKENMIQKYGQDNPMKIDIFKEKMKTTMIDNYDGWYTGTKEYKEKTQQTSLEKYGTTHPSQAKEVRDKAIQTHIKNYGNINNFAIPKIKEKAIQNGHNDKANKKRDNTMLEHYGVTNPFLSKEIREKIKQTNLDKYGVINGGGSKEAQQKIQQTRETNQNLDNELENPDE